MNDKNTIIGTVLISLLIFALLFRNYQQTSEQIEQDDIVAVDSTYSTPVDYTNDFASTNNHYANESSIEDSFVLHTDTQSVHEEELMKKAMYGPFYDKVEGEITTYTIENDKLRIAISSKGGQLDQVELKHFYTHDQKPLLLIDKSQTLDIEFYVNNVHQPIQISQLFFDVYHADSSQITLRCDIGNNRYIQQHFELTEESYLVTYDLQFVHLEQVIALTNTEFKGEWNYQALQQERSLTKEREKSSIYYKPSGGDVGHLAPGRSKEDEFAEKMDWIAFKQLFFTSAILSKGIFKDNIFESEFDKDDTTHVAVYYAKFDLKYDHSPEAAYEMQFFLGPNNYKELKQYDRDLEEIVQLSADFFLFSWVSIISKWLIIPLFNFLEGFIGNYGIIILIMTLLIKTLLMPLTFRSYKSAAKMRLLKPDLEALKEKYKNDQQKQGTEQMKLYSQAGVNPLGGCLPMLFQMPFLLAMFYFFPSSIELRQESFLWAHDLSTYDNILTLPFSIPMYGDHVSLFTLLMTISSIIYARVNAQLQAQPTQPGMEMFKYMPYIFPVFLMFLFNSWPAALTYYYFLSNVISFGQQWVIKTFFIDEEKLHVQLQSNKKKKPKKGGFQARLEEMYKKQQEMQQQQSGKKSKKK